MGAPTTTKAATGPVAWRITYYEPTYGMREYKVTTAAALARALTAHDAAGDMATVREVFAPLSL